jgi:hypothetical protein
MHGKPRQGFNPRKGTTMITLNIAIESKTPLICNAFTDKAAASASSGVRISSNGDKGTPHEQAESKLYIDSDGQPCIPQPNLFRCIIDAGTFFKSGKSKITTAKSSLIPACVEIEGVSIPIISEHGWSVDTRPVRIPSTGGRILCHRPIFNDWALEFTANIDETFITESLFRDMVDAAGARIGLGDFRPSCKGPYGKFLVTSWVSDKATRKKAA